VLILYSAQVLNIKLCFAHKHKSAIFIRVKYMPDAPSELRIFQKTESHPLAIRRQQTNFNYPLNFLSYNPNYEFTQIFFSTIFKKFSRRFGWLSFGTFCSCLRRDAGIGTCAD